MFWSLLIELQCLAPVTTQDQGVTQGFDGCLSVPETKSKRKRQNGHFLDLSSPRLASGLLGPCNFFSLKQPTRLSELIPSAIRNQLAWASFPCTKWPFPINSHAREEETRSRSLKPKRKTQKKKEKRKSRAEALQNCVRGSFLSSIFLLVLCSAQWSVNFS